MPLWTALLAMLLLGERLTSWRLACLGLILLGGVIVAGASIWTGLGWGAGTATGGGEAGEHWKGDLFFICGAVLWSLYGVLVRRLKADPVAATTATTVFAFLLFVPPYALAWMGGWAGSGLDRNSLGEFAWQALFQGVVSVVIAGITFTAMVRSFGPVRSSMITALVPGLSALGAVVFLGEPMHAALLVGLLLVTSGILLSVRGGLAGSSNDGGVVR